ncbi:hypothetical protein OC610_22525, partial [Pseudomonas sp. SAICEU22]
MKKSKAAHLSRGARWVEVWRLSWLREAGHTVTESEMIHVSKSTFSICNRTLSLRRLLKRFLWRDRAIAWGKSLLNPVALLLQRQRCLCVRQKIHVGAGLPA